MTLIASARQNLQKISDTIWELPPSAHESMRVPARFYATEKLVNDMDEAVFERRPIPRDTGQIPSGGGTYRRA